MVPTPSPQPHPTSTAGHRMDMTGATTTWTYREGTVLHMERGLRLKVEKTPTSKKPVQKLSWRDSDWVHDFDTYGHERSGMHRKVHPPPQQPPPPPTSSNQCYHHCCEPNSRDVLRRVLALAENGHHRQAASLITRLDHVTFKNLLAEFPVDVAVDTMPSSIPILEALYARVFLSDGLQFSMKLLQPEAVVIRMVRFVAEDGPYLPPTLPIPKQSSCKDVMNLNNVKMYQQSQLVLTNCERNIIFSSCKKILKVITHSDPNVKLILQAKRRALDGAIDGLSQHGLVGIHLEDSSSNSCQALGNGEALVDLHEALKHELERLVSQLKTAIQKLDELATMGGAGGAGTIGPSGTSGTIGKFSGVNFGAGGTISVRTSCKSIPVEAGHQRLLSLRSDQIESRLIRNKTLLNALEPAFPAKALEGLLGLLRRRVDHDKDALFQFTQLKKEAPHVVATVATSDAAVAPLLMRFARGCRIVLRMMADVSGTDLDCNCANDEEVDVEDTSSSDISGYHSDSDSTLMAGGVLRNGHRSAKTSRVTVLRTAAGILKELLKLLGIQLVTPPPCGNCTFSNVQLGGLVDTIKDLGPALEKVTTLLGDLLKKILDKVQDLKQAIYDAVASIKQTIGPVLDKLSAAVANIETCPALKLLFTNLKLNLYDILDIIQNKWFPLIQTPDLGPTVNKIAQLLEQILPSTFKLLRDAVYNLLQVLQGAGLCTLLGQLIYTLLDPSTNGILYNIVLGVVKTLDNATAQQALSGLLTTVGKLVQGLIPTPGSTTNVPQISNLLSKLLCTLLSLIGLAKNCN